MEKTLEEIFWKDKKFIKILENQIKNGESLVEYNFLRQAKSLNKSIKNTLNTSLENISIDKIKKIREDIRDINEYYNIHSTSMGLINLDKIKKIKEYFQRVDLSLKDYKI